MITEAAIDGMHCAACASRVSAALRRVPGVVRADVTLSPPGARIESDRPVGIEELAQAAASAGGYTLRATARDTGDLPAVSHQSVASESPASLYPLVLIVVFIAGVVGLVHWSRGAWSWHDAMNDFMAGFFLVFSFFKLLDLRGFADAYMSYDLLAGRSRVWALAYPFVELGLGVAYLVRWQPTIVSVTTLVLMLTGAAGVGRALLRKDRIRCACLGTALNLPMTTVTLVEDLAMAAMAAAMLLWTA